MAWPDDPAAELPAPRDDEPERLRQDIADELADHLSCALNRELHFTEDETTARQNVLDRFGSPRKIARKLWFDWMREEFMPPFRPRFATAAALMMIGAAFALIGVYANGNILLRASVWNILTVRLFLAFAITSVAGLLWCVAGFASWKENWRLARFGFIAGFAFLLVCYLIHPGAIPIE